MSSECYYGYSECYYGYSEFYSMNIIYWYPLLPAPVYLLPAVQIFLSSYLGCDQHV